VAFGGGVFLVVWQDLRNGTDFDVLAARVSPAGQVLDEKPIAVAGGRGTQAMPDVASDGKSFLVAWQGVVQEQRVPTYYSFAATVSAQGRVGPSKRLLKHPNPIVAWNGGAYLLVVAQTLWGVRLDAAGKPIDKSPRLIIRSAGRRHRTRAVAGGKGDWLVLLDRSQPDYWGWGGPGAVQCRLVGSDGALAGDLAQYIRDLPGNERNTRKYKLYDDWLDVCVRKQNKTWPHGPCAVAWDGRRYVAVWQRHHVEQSVMFTNCDLLASRVDGWRPLDRPAVPLAAGDAEEKRPALASDGAGGLLCAYEKHAPDGSVRIAAKTLNTQ
jgi:hypothetical protein